MSNGEHQEYYITRFSSSNLADVEKIHTAVYGKTPPNGFFHHKYNTAYTGAEYVGYIAYTPEHLPIAYYGVIPCFIKHNDVLILAAQSADTMTDPKYRFKGLFVELSNLTFQLCRDEGIRLIFGFPNQNSVHGAINKLGWQITETLQCFIIPVSGIPLERLVLKYPVLKKLYKGYMQMVLKRYRLSQKGIDNSVLKDGFRGVCRDDDYLQYKTYSDTSVIRLGNSTLWVKTNNGLIIGDILVADADFDKTMEQLKKLAKKLGIGQIIFQGSPHSRLYTLLVKKYSPIPSFPVLFQDFESGVPLDEIKFTFADIDVF